MIIRFRGGGDTVSEKLGQEADVFVSDLDYRHVVRTISRLGRRSWRKPCNFIVEGYNLTAVRDCRRRRWGELRRSRPGWAGGSGTRSGQSGVDRETSRSCTAAVFETPHLSYSKIISPPTLLASHARMNMRDGVTSGSAIVTYHFGCC